MIVENNLRARCNKHLHCSRTDSAGPARNHSDFIFESYVHALQFITSCNHRDSEGNPRKRGLAASPKQ